jgi:nucleoside-diphosphate-sugar epimerase
MNVLVTGGTGFIGSALVRALVRQGHRVRSFDDGSRGVARRLADIGDDVELASGDVRDAESVLRATEGVEVVCHLAAVNGTEFFYTRPELVLDVAVRGMMNVLDACRRRGIGQLFVASSSEVYQTPAVVPTDERAALSIPDPLNPRYSYAGGKIASELLALNWGRTGFERVVIFRPHNVYGPDMGWEHVIPQLALRTRDIAQASASGPLRVPIQGDGGATRAFTHISDLVEGVMLVLQRGEHLGIYHIGTDVETSILDLVAEIGRCFGRSVEILPGPGPAGGTRRRCPDISKLRALGFRPQVTLREGLCDTVRWYSENAHQRP